MKEATSEFFHIGGETHSTYNFLILQNRRFKTWDGVPRRFYFESARLNRKKSFLAFSVPAFGKFIVTNCSIGLSI